MDSEKEEEGSSSEEEPEPESRDGQGTGQDSLADHVPKLSKAQERELRRVRKTDYSWLSTLVDA